MLGKIINTFGTRLFSAILNLLIGIVISRFLGPEGKGQQGLIITTIAYILVFANLMGGGAIVYLTPRHHFAAILLPAYLWSVITGGIFAVVLYFFKLVDTDFILHICILSVINAFTAVNSSILIGKERISSSNFIALIQPLFLGLSLFVFFFILHENTIQAYVISLYIAFAASYLTSIFPLVKFTEKFNILSFSSYLLVIRQMLRYGVLNQLAHIFQLLSFRMSYYWLEQLYSEAEVGVYSNGTSLVESIWLISRSISMVQYSRISNTSDKGYAQRITINLTFAALILSLLLLVILVFLPPEFFVWIYGDGFAEVGLVIQSLAPGVLFFNIALIVGHYFSGTGKYHVNTIASFAGLLISVALFSVLIPRMGITGAGWATSISYTLTSVIVIIWFQYEAGLRFSDYFPSGKEIREIRSTVIELFKGKQK